MQVVACAVNPSGRFIRLGLTATHPHAIAVCFIALIVNMHNEFVVYIFDRSWIQRYIMDFIVQNDERGIKMEDKEMLQIWLRLKEEAAYERGIFFTLDEIIRRCRLNSFPVDDDGLVLRVEQIENICDDIRSRYLDADFHV